MPLKLNSSGGGSVTLDTPSTASTYTLTVPAITGTAVVTGSSGTVSQGMLASGVAGTGPAFSVSMVGTFSIGGTTYTKATLNTKQFDTANCFDSTTNYRFTPNVAGYYQFNATYGQLINGTSYAGLYKNGALAFQGGGSANPTVSGLLYLNGTTDYVELYLFSSFAATNVNCTSTFNSLCGFLARAA